MKIMFKKVKQNVCVKLNKGYRKSRMFDENNQTVGEIRAMYQRQLESHRREIKVIEEKLKLLEVFAADAKPMGEQVDKYKEWGLTPAVIDAVNSLCEIGVAHPDGVETFDIHKYLEQYGFEGTDNFAVALHVTLKRLSDKSDGRLIVTRDKNFVKRYKPGKKTLGVAAVRPVKQ
jgi:hypothetical protein